MFSQNFKHNFWVFAYMFKIQFMYWIQNPMNLFLGLGVSMYTMVCWLAFKSGDPFLMISGISVGLVRNAMYIHLKMITDWRGNGTVQRITMTPTSETIRNISLVAFNIFSTAIICLIMFAVAMIFFPQQRALLPMTNQGMVWAGIILCWFTSFLFANFLYISIRQNKICQMVGLLIYFSTMYFLGLGFPFEVIVKVQWLNDVLYAHPFRYVMNIVQAGFVNRPDFIFDGTIANGTASGYHMHVDFGYDGLGWLPYILAVAVIVLYGTLFYAKYNFNIAFHKRNKYGKFIVNRSSSRYIHKVKAARSCEQIKIMHRERMTTLANSSPKMKKIVDQVQREVRIEEWFKRRKD